MVGGSRGAVESVMGALTPGAFVTLFALSKAAGIIPIVPHTADLRSGRGATGFAWGKGIW